MVGAISSWEWGSLSPPTPAGDRRDALRSLNVIAQRSNPWSRNRIGGLLRRFAPREGDVPGLDRGGIKPLLRWVGALLFLVGWTCGGHELAFQGLRATETFHLSTAPRGNRFNVVPFDMFSVNVVKGNARSNMNFPSSHDKMHPVLFVETSFKGNLNGWGYDGQFERFSNRQIAVPLLQISNCLNGDHHTNREVFWIAWPSICNINFAIYQPVITTALCGIIGRDFDCRWWRGGDDQMRAPLFPCSEISLMRLVPLEPTHNANYNGAQYRATGNYFVGFENILPPSFWRIGGRSVLIVCVVIFLCWRLFIFASHDITPISLLTWGIATICSILILWLWVVFSSILQSLFRKYCR